MHEAKVVGYVVNSSCTLRQPIAYPDSLSVGFRVAKLGNSSVTYELSIFKELEAEASAFGLLVHVYVNRDQNRSVNIPAPIRQCLEEILVK
nr:hotdog domain-containing protein [Marinobacter sp. JH2]